MALQGKNKSCTLATQIRTGNLWRNEGVLQPTTLFPCWCLLTLSLLPVLEIVAALVDPPGSDVSMPKAALGWFHLPQQAGVEPKMPSAAVCFDRAAGTYIGQW